MDDMRNTKIGIVGEGRPSKAMESLMMMHAVTSAFDRPISRPEVKVCKRAKGNTRTYGTKCKHGGSCDGTKPRCRFAIY